MSRHTVRVLANVVLAVGAAVTVTPLAWMVLAAFRDPAQVLDPISGWSPSVTSLVEAFTALPFVRYYGTSLLVSTTIVLGQLVLCLPAGYALARLRFRGRGLVFALVVVALVLPTQALALPAYVMLGRLGWIDTPAALIVPFLSAPFAIFLFRQYLLSVPRSIFDAARVDGVGPVAVVWRVVVPIAVPAIVANSVFAFVHHWNDLFWPSLVLTSDTWATVPYAVSRFAATGQEGLQYGTQMATGVLATVPLLIGFAFAQRLFVRGVGDGAVR